MLGVNYKTASQNSFHKQSGAALLAFMLIIVAGSAYYLLEKFRTNAIITQNHEATGIALRAAKEALIGYAVTYPDKVNASEGPGYLLCPDIDNDGDAETICALGGANETIGRLPYETLELPDLRDSSGERLWYTLSENFRNNPKIVPLNSETPSQAELTVDGTNDIVAIIFAPGAPVGTQDRAANSNAVANYLEDDNSNLDTSFVTTAGGNFNDRIIVITRQELMQAVEKRVMGEIATILTTYRNTFNAYPWLTSFADPKSSSDRLTGSHDGGNDSANLVDTSVDFTDWNVQVGDTVRNITDNSAGIVTAVSATTLTIAGGLSMGTDNNFDDDDEYVVDIRSYGAVLSGVMTSGSSNLVLEDTSQDFDEIGISAGDVVDNITDGSSGKIISVSNDQITVDSLSVGTFDNGDAYQIRSNFGQATASSSGFTLEDTNKNFDTMGVAVGDLVVNLTDGSSGRVESIDVSNVAITVDGLKFGVENDFDNDDFYYFPRFVTDSSTREGFLSFHEPGKAFSTVFDIDWGLTAATAADTTVTSAATHDGYTGGLATAVETSSGTISQPLSINNDGVCIWTTPTIAECTGTAIDSSFLSGKATAASTGLTLVDTAKDFTLAGVKRGDRLASYTDAAVVTGLATSGSAEFQLEDTTKDFNALGITAGNYVVRTTGDGLEGLVDSVDAGGTTLTVTALGDGSEISFEDTEAYSIYSYKTVGLVVDTVNSSTSIDLINAAGPTLTINDGKAYRISLATSKLEGTATSHVAYNTTYANRFRMFDNSENFASLQRGDAIENLTYGGISVITQTGIDGVLGHWVEGTQLTGGSYDDIYTNENYRIHYDYILDERHYGFDFRFNGILEQVASNGVRKRDVCLGYDAACAALGTATTIPANGNISSVVTIRDYDSADVEIGNVELTIPAAGISGNVRLTNIDYYLYETANEIPPWLLKNDWHKLMYIAYSSGYAPGAAESCTAGVDCLTLTLSGAPTNDKHAIVIAAGDETNTIRDASCSVVASTVQTRYSGKINSYYELENCDQGDDVFQFGTADNAAAPLNDQIKVIE